MQYFKTYFLQTLPDVDIPMASSETSSKPASVKLSGKVETNI